MKRKLLLIVTLFIGQAIVAMADQPEIPNATCMTLEPTNKELVEAWKFAVNKYNFEAAGSRTLPVYLRTLVGMEDNNPEKIGDITKVMTCLLFDTNNDGKNMPATPVISKEYLKGFSPLLISIKIAEPKNLCLKSAWQILGLMPPLYDTLCAMQLLDDRDPLYFNKSYFKQETGMELTNDYMNIIAKAACSDYAHKHVLIQRFVEKIGNHVPFFDYVTRRIPEADFFRYTLEALQFKYKHLKKADAQREAEHDPQAQQLKKDITLVFWALNQRRKVLTPKSAEIAKPTSPEKAN